MYYGTKAFHDELLICSLAHPNVRTEPQSDIGHNRGRVPSVEVRKRINLYLTWTSVSTLELWLQRETATCNLPLNYCNKTFRLPCSIFKTEQWKTVASVDKETVCKTNKTGWVAKQLRQLDTLTTNRLWLNLCLWLPFWFQVGWVRVLPMVGEISSSAGATNGPSPSAIAINTAVSGFCPRNLVRAGQTSWHPPHGVSRHRWSWGGWWSCQILRWSNFYIGSLLTRSFIVDPSANHTSASHTNRSSTKVLFSMSCAWL